MLDHKGAPQVEGHKAIASGLDIFTFGGHTLRATFEGPDVSVHKLLGFPYFPWGLIMFNLCHYGFAISLVIAQFDLCS